MATSHIPLASLERKKINGRFAPTIPECQCKHCGVTYRPKRKDRVYYCSRECAYALRKASAQPSDVLAAKAKHRQACKKKHFEAVDCRVCSKQFTPKMLNQYLCSKECRMEQARRDGPKYNKRGLKRNRKPRPCGECGQSFVPEYGDKRTKYCSRQCNKKQAKRLKGGSHIRKRMRIVGLPYEPINVMKLFERDQWRCQICGCKTPKQLRGSIEPKAPEVDHRIPISKGGGHVWSNVQCACRSCNNIKGNRSSIGQLPLFIN